MVHALKESWRVLRPNGILVDMRPRHSNQLLERVTDGQAVTIRHYSDTHRIEKDNASDAAIAEVVNSSLFCLDRGTTFGYVRLYDTASELMAYFATRNPPVEHPADIVEQIHHAENYPNSVFRFSNDMQLNCYRKLELSGK